MLLVDHIAKIRDRVVWERSHIQVYVEHNLGFEAEHHERALRGIQGVSFYRDEKRQRIGILTTLQASTLLFFSLSNFPTLSIEK